ncbi:MAG TPA: HEAT repeat domain-containing protein [Verrucomicrobiae bacterium]|nr:HEAT repeat domain-containing protein [Verrucomicrobiae bacterium]
MSFLWPILQQLKSADPEKRLHAVARLAETEGADSFEGLSKAAADDDSRVREAALIALGGAGDQRATVLYLGAMRDRDPKVRQAAVGYLHDDGSEKTHDAVCSALRDSDPVVRALAARFLQRSAWRPKDSDDEICLAVAHGEFVRAASLGVGAIAPLERVLEGGGFSQQAAAAEALGTIRDERVLPPLRRAAKSSDHVVCLAAIGALANAGGPEVLNDLVPLFKHADHRIRAAAIETAGRFDCRNYVEVLRRSLRDSRWEVRCAATDALGKVKGASTADVLAPLLKDQSPEVRTAAAAGLGNLGDSRMIEVLVPVLIDAEAPVRSAVAAALTRIDVNWASSGPAQKLAPQLQTALVTGDWASRRAAAYALEQLGKQHKALDLSGTTNFTTSARFKKLAVLSAFTELLRDADADLRLAAVDSLAKLGGVEIRSPLMTALSDADEAVKLMASQALADLGTV